jgi:hypothetical protein
VVNYSAGKQETTAAAAPAAGLRLTPAAIYGGAPSMRFLDANRDHAVSAGELLALDFNGDGSVDADEFTYQDFNNDGVLGDNEADVDGDGLTNYDEQHGRMTPEYWKGVYKDERPYTAWVAYETTEFMIPDTDGDGRLDALDDQDADSFINIAELSRSAAQDALLANQSAYGRVNPLNPCLPAMAWSFVDANTTLPTTVLSPTCMLHPPITNGPAPFDGSPGGNGYDIND